MKLKYILIFLISQSILLPLIAGLIRLRRIDRIYQPFFILIITGFLTEIISFVSIRWISGTNVIPSNLDALLEFSLILWQFYIWRPTKLYRWAFPGLLII